MQKQALLIKSGLKIVVYNYIPGFIHRADTVAFKIVIDYIVRNFDPTGINIGGLIDSFCYILVKPSLLSFVKMFKGGTAHYRESALSLWKSLMEGKFAPSHCFTIGHRCLQK
jgi:hypothetical protein